MSRELKVLRRFYVEVTEISHQESCGTLPEGLVEALNKVDDYYDPSKQQLDLELIEDMTEDLIDQEAIQDLQAD